MSKQLTTPPTSTSRLQKGSNLDQFSSYRRRRAHRHIQRILFRAPGLERHLARTEKYRVWRLGPQPRIRFSGGGVIGVETNEGNFFADKVVVASGAWTEKLMRASNLEVPIGRERLQVLATKPLPMQIKPVVYGPTAAKAYGLFRNLPSWDDQLFRSKTEEESGYEMLTLAAQRANGEILIGCPMDYPSEVDLFPTLDGLKAIADDIISDFPSLRKAGIDRVWAGVLPFTSDLVPVIDEITPGLIMAAGHVFGNSAGPMTGKTYQPTPHGNRT